jgi:acetoacetyl-CoA synthetase
MLADPLWTPSDEYIRRHTLTAFANHLERTGGIAVKQDFGALHRWSVTDRGAFWRAVWEFMGVVGEGSLEPAVVDADALPGAR